MNLYERDFGVCLHQVVACFLDCNRELFHIGSLTLATVEKSSYQTHRYERRRL